MEFYEIAKKLSGQPGWALLEFLFEYKGVALMPVENKDGPVPGDKELLIMRNLFDGKKKPRYMHPRKHESRRGRQINVGEKDLDMEANLNVIILNVIIKRLK